MWPCARGSCSSSSQDPEFDILVEDEFWGIRTSTNGYSKLQVSTDQNPVGIHLLVHKKTKQNPVVASTLYTVNPSILSSSQLSWDWLPTILTSTEEMCELVTAIVEFWMRCFPEAHCSNAFHSLPHRALQVPLQQAWELHQHVPRRREWHTVCGRSGHDLRADVHRQRGSRPPGIHRFYTSVFADSTIPKCFFVELSLFATDFF